MLALLAFLFEEMFARASNSKGGFDDDGGNTNNARKAWHVKQYTQQQLNRHRKPQEPINKLKEAEFGTCLRENYIEIHNYYKISQNLAKSLD